MDDLGVPLFLETHISWWYHIIILRSICPCCPWICAAFYWVMVVLAGLSYPNLFSYSMPYIFHTYSYSIHYTYSILFHNHQFDGFPIQMIFQAGSELCKLESKKKNDKKTSAQVALPRWVCHRHLYPQVATKISDRQLPRESPTHRLLAEHLHSGSRSAHLQRWSPICLNICVPQNSTSWLRDWKLLATGGKWPLNHSLPNVCLFAMLNRGLFRDPESRVDCPQNYEAVWYLQVVRSTLLVNQTWNGSREPKLPCAG